MADPRGEIERRIHEFVRDDPRNRLTQIDGTPIFDAPLLGVADGDDPLFQRYKEVIGPFHLTPRGALVHAAACAGRDAPASTAPVRILCWALPIAAETRRSNRQETSGPSRRWAHTRTFGEQFNDALRRFVERLLHEAGRLAIAPVTSPLFKSFSEGTAWPPASNWSERHILYAAGMGTFSLSDGFITGKGIAMRCGSVVTDLPLPVTPRRYATHLENCLHYTTGNCDKCIARCPAGAISAYGHDKGKCLDYVYNKVEALKAEYGVEIVGCGLCQTGVPCEAGIPKG
jgi:epoxyqueuosine reductase QueG